MFDRDILDKYIGKFGVDIDIGHIRMIVEKVDRPKIERDLKKLISDYLKKNCLYFDEIDTAIIQTKEILSREEMRVKFEKALDTLRLEEKAEENKKKFEDMIANHPKNGNEGYWQIIGIRHCPFVWAKTAREALDKALKAEVIGEWELYGESVEFVGQPEILG